jgi:hypothetical protein
VINRRECAGRRLTGQRLTTPTRSNGSRPIGATEIRPSLFGIPLSIGRSACLQPPPTYSGGGTLTWASVRECHPIASGSGREPPGRASRRIKARDCSGPGQSSRIIGSPPALMK